MLRFLAPGYLFAALAASAALIAAHFIVRRQPRALVLPTARFVPDAPVLTTGWARTPTDIAVLALRVLCVLLAGLALAGPFLGEKAGGIGRVVLVDRSRSVGDSVELSDSVQSVRTAGDVLVSYGSSAFEEREEGVRPQRAESFRAERGSLSAGIVAAKRAAARFRGRADSVELVIVSSFASEQLDAATARVRAEWPGRARLVRVSATPETGPARAPALAATADDPLAVAVGASLVVTPADVRIARGGLGASDSAWTREQPGRVLVHWPMATAPAGFVARATPTTAVGLATRSHAMVAPFHRGWQHAPALGSRAVAWWIDGDVAAAEVALGSSCVRSVAVPVSAAGDFVLRPDFHDVVRDLVQPCGGARAFTPMAGSSLAMLTGRGPLAPSREFAQPRAEPSWTTALLLLSAIFTALIELLVRRGRRAGRNGGTHAEPGPEMRKVA